MLLAKTILLVVFAFFTPAYSVGNEPTYSIPWFGMGVGVTGQLNKAIFWDVSLNGLKHTTSKRIYKNDHNYFDCDYSTSQLIDALIKKTLRHYHTKWKVQGGFGGWISFHQVNGVGYLIPVKNDSVESEDKADHNPIHSKLNNLPRKGCGATLALSISYVVVPRFLVQGWVMGRLPIPCGKMDFINTGSFTIKITGNFLLV